MMVSISTELLQNIVSSLDVRTHLIPMFITGLLRKMQVKDPDHQIHRSRHVMERSIHGMSTETLKTSM